MTIESEFADLGDPALAYIVQEAGFLVGYNIGVIVLGLQDSSLI